MYKSTITFTLDTICPWTYIAFTRLTKALAIFQREHPNSSATFELKLAPYQLFPDFSSEGVNKYEWYKNEKYGSSEERMQMYINAMKNLGMEDDLNFDYTSGVIANTLHAHRILQFLQDNHSPQHALSTLSSLYEQYFSQSAHPSSSATLITACMSAGLSLAEAEEIVQDEREWLADTKAAIREQASNGVDSVPYVVFEGRKRDFTLIGAQSVEEYMKVLRQVVKEAM